MAIERLTDLYQREVTNGDSYQSVDFHYVEIAAILLEKYQIYYYDSTNTRVVFLICLMAKRSEDCCNASVRPASKRPPKVSAPSTETPSK